MHTAPDSLILRCHTGVCDIPAHAWDGLAGTDPFLSHAWLCALEATGCVGPDTGWVPRILAAWDGGDLRGAMPLYEKHHSWGEYVFDFAWADAYRRAGLPYYPKLVAAVPYTPVTGSRVLAASPGVRTRLLAAAKVLAADLKASSLHLLFLPEAERQALPPDMLVRCGVQFHWHNAGWRDFEDFLGSLNHDKRKKIRQERRKVAESGLRIECVDGAALGPGDWADFYRCYDTTYRRHGQLPYLSLPFFRRIGEHLADRILLVRAQRQGRFVAAALFLHDGRALFGRWWGALEFVPNLHFELCYYRAIEYAIARGFARFEAGAQGEHKLSRGLVAQPTYSAHWLAHPSFQRAVADYLAVEGQHTGAYISELNERSPYKGG